MTLIKLTKEQGRLLKKWSLILLIVYSLFLLFLNLIPILFLLIAIIFAIGLTLRILKVYPGKTEPLILDAAGAFIALLIALILKFQKLPDAISFILILIGPIIIILWHVIYILKNKM